MGLVNSATITAFNFGDVLPRDVCQFSDLFIAKTETQESANIRNLAFAVLGRLRHFFYSCFAPVGFEAPNRYCILDVLFLSPLIKMIWVDTKPIVTSMISLVSWLELPLEFKNKGHPVDTYFVPADPNITIASFSDSSIPNNTIRHGNCFPIVEFCSQGGVVWA